MDIDVGHRLRFMRRRHGLSQRALAKRTGVANSTISLIEANHANPSIGALKRILEGIPIELAEFFSFEPDKPKEVVLSGRGPDRDWQGRNILPASR